MKNYLFLVVIPLLVCLVACNNDSSELEITEPEDNIVIGYANLKDLDLDSWFDEIVIKDTEHYRLIKRRNNGSIEWDMFVSQTDTTMVCYNEDGIIKNVSYNNTHLVLGAYSQNYVKVGVLYEDNSYEVIDLKTDIDWDQHIKNIFKSRAPANDLDRYNAAVNTANLALLDDIFTQILVKKGIIAPQPNPYGFIVLMAQLGGISSSMTVEQIEAVDLAGDVLTLESAVLFENPVGLIILNAKVYAKVIQYLIYGYLDDDFTLEAFQRVFLKRKFIEDLELVITQASFRPDNQTVTWEGGSFNFNLWIDQIGSYRPENLAVIRDGDLPEWIDEASPKYDGDRWQLNVSIQPNFNQEPRHYDIKCQILGSSKNETATLHLTQTGQISVSPNPIVFQKKETLPVTVIAYAGETWKIKSVPDWCEATTKGIMNGFLISPKQYKNGLEGNVVLTISTLGGRGYDLTIPVLTGLSWDYTKWQVTGKLQMTDEDISDSQDINGEMVLENISEKPINISQDGVETKCYVNESGQLVYEMIYNQYTSFSDGYISIKGQNIITFTRTSATTARGTATGNVHEVEHVNGKYGYHDEVDIKLSGNLDAVLQTSESRSTFQNLPALDFIQLLRRSR